MGHSRPRARVRAQRTRGGSHTPRPRTWPDPRARSIAAAVSCMSCGRTCVYFWVIAGVGFMVGGSVAGSIF